MSDLMEKGVPSPSQEVGVVEDKELRRVQAFDRLIGEVTQISPNNVGLDVMTEHPTDEAIKRFNLYERSGATTLYLSGVVASSLAIDGSQISFEPRISSAGKSSRHGVFFGDLQIGRNQAIPVAVKPHEASSDSPAPVASCLKDFLNNDAVKEFGLHTPQAVGYIIGKEGDAAYSLSLLDESLSTLDGIDWSNFFPDTSKDPGMQEIWRELSQQVGILHSTGNASHGDLAPRNAATSADGGVFMIDWETANLSKLPPRDGNVTLLRSHSELSILQESMCRPTHVNYKKGIGLFYGKGGDWWEGFREIFYDEYCETRRMEASNAARPRQGGMQRLKEVEAELDALTTMLESDMQRYKEECAEL